MPATEATDATDPGMLDARSRDRARTLRAIEDLRRLQQLGPSAMPPGMSEQDVARWLTTDTVATLSRSNIVLDETVDVLVDVLEERRRSNDLTARDLHLREQVELRRQAAEREREQRRWSIVAGVVTPLGKVIAALLADNRIQGAITGAFVLAIGSAAAYLFGQQP